jgi:hypothetical protein
MNSKLDKQGRQRTFNVTLWRVLATIVAVEKQKVLHILSVRRSLSYPASNAHAPCCHLWPVRLNNIFPRYLIKSAISKQVPGHKICVMVSSTNFV